MQVGDKALRVIADEQKWEVALEAIQDILEGDRVRPFQVLKVVQGEGGTGRMLVTGTQLHLGWLQRVQECQNSCLLINSDHLSCLEDCFNLNLMLNHTRSHE